MKEGKDFDRETVERNREDDNTINIHAYADEMLIGGMAYQFDTRLEHPPEIKDTQKCDKIAKKLLDCVDIPKQKIKSVRIKRITLNIDFETDDDC